MPNQDDTGVPANQITAHLAATFAGLPVYVHTIGHREGVVLVDTGMIDSTPELDEEGAPVPMPENIPRDVVCVINIGGDVAYTFEELETGMSEGQRRVLALAAPTWLTHAEEGPRVPQPTKTTRAA